MKTISGFSVITLMCASLFLRLVTREVIYGNSCIIIKNIQRALGNVDDVWTHVRRNKPATSSPGTRGTRDTFQSPRENVVDEEDKREEQGTNLRRKLVSALP